MTLTKEQLILPQLPQEVVPVEALGGDIIVRGILLTEHLYIVQFFAPINAAIDKIEKEYSAALPGADGDEAEVLFDASDLPATVREKYDRLKQKQNQRLPMMLSYCVVDSNGERLATQRQWDEFSALHSAAAFELFAIANRLCGLSLPDDEKKSSDRPGDQSGDGVSAETGTDPARVGSNHDRAGMEPVETILRDGAVG